jgi:hypothetical protein
MRDSARKEKVGDGAQLRLGKVREKRNCRVCSLEEFQRAVTLASRTGILALKTQEL